MTAPTSKTIIPTEQASRYLQQLCKHFAHKLPATFDEQLGQIVFSIGECRLAATEGVLRLSLESPNAAEMPQLQDVVERHLVRFAFREELKMDWRAA